MTFIGETEGRGLFGNNVAGYDQVRPPYPDWMFSLLVEKEVLFPNAATLEIGAGNGLATRHLIKHGLSPLVLLEPDKKFGPLLLKLLETSPVTSEVHHEAFEDTLFEPSVFDLVVSATAFHWLDPGTRIEKLARIVKPSGHVALLWNVFGDASRTDPFHEATVELLGGLDSSPSTAPNKVPFALDRGAREQEFLQAGHFELHLYAESRWTLLLNAARVKLLYEGFSSIARLAEVRRKEVLSELVRIAETKFSGEVTRNMTSVLYVFKRT